MPKKKSIEKNAREVANAFIEFHRKKLTEIVNNPSCIGEDNTKITSKIRETSWRTRLKKQGLTDSMVPDLFLVYFPDRKYPDGYVVPVELKVGNGGHRDKAMRQLNSGRHYSEAILRRPCDHARYVHLDEKSGFISEYITLEELDKV